MAKRKTTSEDVTNRLYFSDPDDDEMHMRFVEQQRLFSMLDLAKKLEYKKLKESENDAGDHDAG